MKKNILFIVLATLCLFFKAMAQEKPNNITALKIGDKVPDITINYIINYKDVNGKPATTAKISDFKGKLLILDFWATWCSGCIQNFPKMEGLQQEFGEKIQMLAVTHEDTKKVSQFFATKTGPDGKKYKITSIVGDKILASLFPHTFIPHCIIISPDNKVIAITDADEITSANITKLLENQQLNFNIKKDINASAPLFLSNYAPVNDLLQYSILLKGNYTGLGSGRHDRVDQNINRGCAMTNTVLLLIYEAAVRSIFEAKQEYYDSKRRILNVADTSKITMTKSASGRWDKDNHYTYDLIVPLANADSLYQFMLRDLNRYTSYNGQIQKRKAKCWILVKTGNNNKFQSAGGNPRNTLFYETPSKLTNYPISYLVSRLNEESMFQYPVIDETGYAGNVDMTFTSFDDIPSLRKQLKGYGLNLIEGYRQLDMFILSDKK